MRCCVPGSRPDSVALPTFTTERLILRPRTIDDYDACLAMDRDPAVVRYIPGPWDDATAHAAFLRHRIARPYPDGLGYWCVFPKASLDRFLGWVLLIPRDAVGPEVEIGWRLLQSAWGRGYAPEAAAAIVRHAFETVGLDRIIAEIHPEHARSQRVAEKIGLRRAQSRKLLVFEMTRDRFAA
jgi:RimJ/RimL family protein N-acetyltransferase